MGILIDKTARILIQGVTTPVGRQNTSLMLENKVEIVAGVSPGRYGQEVMGVPVYDKVREAIKRHKVDLSIIFVPKGSVLNAAIEAIEEGIPLLIIVTGDIPVTDTIKIKNLAEKKDVKMIGPGSAGVFIPGETKAGTISNDYVSKGNVGVITRTVGNEIRICQSLYKEEIGESTIVSLGGEEIIGLGYVEILKLFEEDDETDVVVIGGETKGRLEEDAARYIKKSKFSKPVLTYLFGSDRNRDIAHQKEKLLREAGVTVVDDIWEIGQVIKEATVED